jgi:hypothetical protein
LFDLPLEYRTELKQNSNENNVIAEESSAHL